METYMEKDFIKAAKSGDSGKIRELLKLNPNLIHFQDSDECTALHYASWKGHAEAVGLLLDSGADVHARNKNGHWGPTALHAAAHGNHNIVAEVLIERGADVNALDESGNTPLFHTTIHNASAARMVLLKHGAK
jgi:26S proteasome non-ATPase regulatory subunit 10